MIAVIVSVKMKVSEHDMVAANTVTVESDIDDSIVGIYMCQSLYHTYLYSIVLYKFNNIW